MEQILTLIAEQDTATLVVVGGLIVIFLVVMFLIKKIVVGILTVVISLALLVGGSYFLFNQAVDNIDVVDNELRVALPYVEEFTLPLDDVSMFIVSEPVGDRGYIISVIRNGGASDIAVEVPAAVFAVPGAVDRIETALLGIKELEPYYEQIRQGAIILRNSAE